MKEMKKAHRQKGVVDYVKVEGFRGEEDPNTAWIGINFEGGGQGFGGLYLANKEAIDGFTGMVTEVFGVKKFEDLVGKECYVLRNFSNWNANIVGLESIETGRKMTVNDFRRAMGYGVELNELQQRIKSTKESIIHHERRAAEDRLKVRQLERGQDYVEWDKES